MNVTFIFPYAEAEKIIKESAKVIGSAFYIGHSVRCGTEDERRFLLGLEKEIKIKVIERNPDASNYAHPYAGNLTLASDLREWVAKELVRFFWKFGYIEFAPWETKSGEDNFLLITRIDDCSSRVSFQGRRGSLLADNNCCGGDFFGSAARSGHAHSFQVEEFDSSMPQRHWFE